MGPFTWDHIIALAAVVVTITKFLYEILHNKKVTARLAPERLLYNQFSGANRLARPFYFYDTIFNPLCQDAAIGAACPVLRPGSLLLLQIRLGAFFKDVPPGGVNGHNQGKLLKFQLFH